MHLLLTFTRLSHKGKYMKMESVWVRLWWVWVGLDVICDGAKVGEGNNTHKHEYMHLVMDLGSAKAPSVMARCVGSTVVVWTRVLEVVEAW